MDWFQVLLDLWQRKKITEEKINACASKGLITQEQKIAILNS